jgi:hypothetical protein
MCLQHFRHKLISPHSCFPEDLLIMNAGSKNKSAAAKVIKTARKSVTRKTVKITDEKASPSKKQKKKVNLLRLCSEMNKFADDANDKEIIKRFKISIISSITEDISKINLIAILKKPEDVDLNSFSESIQPYLKHYFFMINRNKNRKK